MSFPTRPAFVHVGSWDDETRSHPAMKFMEEYTRNAIDTKRFDLPPTDYHAQDFIFQKPDGSTFIGAELALAEVEKTYAPFSSHLHDPVFLSCHETPNGGWEMIGIANLYVNFPVPGDGKKVVDDFGREWDCVTPSAFLFEYQKGGKHGIELKSTRIYGDSGPAVVAMLKRGMLKPEQLLA